LDGGIALGRAATVKRKLAVASHNGKEEAEGMNGVGTAQHCSQGSPPLLEEQAAVKGGLFWPYLKTVRTAVGVP